MMFSFSYWRGLFFLQLLSFSRPQNNLRCCHFRTLSPCPIHRGICLRFVKACCNFWCALYILGASLMAYSLTHLRLGLVRLLVCLLILHWYSRYCFSLDLYLKSLSLFLFDKPPPLLLMNFFSNPDNFLSKYFFISLIEFLSAILTTAPPCTINYRLVIWEIKRAQIYSTRVYEYIAERTK